MFVYFISAFGEQHLKRIKIGYSKDPVDRLQKLQTGSPVRLELLGTVRCRDESHAKSIEKLAHNIFYKQRRQGEWFHLSKKHLAQIKSLIIQASNRVDQ